MEKILQQQYFSYINYLIKLFVRRTRTICHVSRTKRK